MMRLRLQRKQNALGAPSTFRQRSSRRTLIGSWETRKRRSTATKKPPNGWKKPIRAMKSFASNGMKRRPCWASEFQNQNQTDRYVLARACVCVHLGPISHVALQRIHQFFLFSPHIFRAVYAL